IMFGLLLMAGCNDEGFFNGENGTPEGDSAVASMTLLASSPQMGSSPDATVTITAILKDSSNNLVADAPVVFSASSGALEVIQPVTGAAGQAAATLSPGGDPTNRAITVSANTGGVSQTVNIAVSGTNLSISGENSAT